MISYAISPIRQCRFHAVVTGLRCGLLLVSVLLGLLATGARAQTASFSYAIATLGGGFNLTGHVAVDGSDNVYVTDTNNSAIKEIPAGCTSASCVMTLGGGFNHPSGVALDGSGNVYVADTYNNAIKEIPIGCVSSSCVTQLAPDAYFNGPYGVAVDGSGNVYVAATFGGEVREIPVGCNSSSCVTILGGGFGTPTDVAVDGSGNVYASDDANSAVLEIPPGCASSSCVITLGGGFAYPYGVAVDGSGNVYVADTSHIAIKEMPAGCASSSCVSTLGGGFWFPQGVAVDRSGNVYVGDTGNSLVKEIMTGAANLFTVPVGNTSAALTLTFTFNSAGSLNSTTPFQVLTQGAKSLDFNAAAAQESNACNGSTVYAAADTCTVDVTLAPTAAGIRDGAVELLNAGGSPIGTARLYGTGQGPQVVFSPPTQGTLGGGFSAPTGVAVDGGNNVYVADESNNAVKEMPAGCTSSSCVTTLGGGFSVPFGVAVDGGGNVYVADTYNSAVKEMPPGCASSSCVTTLGGGFSYPWSLALDGSGNVYVADYDNGAVKEMPAGCASSSCVTTLGGGFNHPYGVSVDGSGNVYIADFGATVIEQMPAGCASSSCVTTLGGGFGHPTGVAVDSSGTVYVADQYSSAVKEMPAGCASSSCVTTLGGGFANPTSVALDGNGNVYVADEGNNGVKEINRANAPSLSFAATALGSTSSDSPQTVTVQNIGNAPLAFAVPSGGNNPGISLGEFTLNSSEESACPQVTASSTAGTLASGASCLLSISFKPTTTGSFDAALTLTDNNLNAPSPNYAVQGIRLIGTTPGSLPAITAVSPIASQQTQSITVTGSGFGSLAAFTGDSNFIELVDNSGTPWAAGHTGNGVTFAVSSWTDSQIILGGLSGSYGTTHCIRPGDHLSVNVWNAQTGAGPAIYSLVAASGTDNCSTQITSVSPIVSSQTQTITITGAGFGTQAAYTGDSSYITLADTTGNWYAGQDGNTVTLDVSSWTDKQIVLGGFEGTYGVIHCIRPGDNLSITVWNAQTGTGTASYSIVASGGPDNCPTAITSVSAILPQQTQTITIKGEGFGTHAAYTGDSNYIQVSDSTRSWNAGYGTNGVTLVVSSWTDYQIVLGGFAGSFGPNHCIAPGDHLSISVWNAGTGAGPVVYPVVASGGASTCP